MINWQKALRWVLMCGLAGWLAACGGGGGGSDPAVPAASLPAISLQPVSASAVSGTAASFSISATGSALAYQWQRSTDNGVNWAAIAGATSASYTLAAVDVSMNGQQFRVVVSSGGGSVTSSPVTLSVTAAVAAPAIGVQPVAQSATAGGSASFAVTASGTALAYQWQDSRDGGTTWAAIAGANAATLTLPSLTAADNGRQLRVVVSNSAGAITSAAVTLTVNPAAAAPTITAQPASASVTAPQAATFSVQASGTPAPACQWQQSVNSGSTWTAISGATSCSYTTPATSTADSGKQFRAVVSNTAGSVNSAAATLTVTVAAVAPAISSQPQNVAVNAAATATFTVAATGTPTPAYQWQLSSDGGLSFVTINGATSSSYTTPATVAGDNGKRYRVVVSNTAGTVTSAAAVLTVNASAVSPLSGRTWQTGQKLLDGASTSISLSASVIDDAGRVTLVYGNNGGTPNSLYVLRGTPNASGSAPSWTAPVRLAPVGSGTLGTTGIQAVAAPGGDVGVLWYETVPCGPAVPAPAGTVCVATYIARYRVATANWEAPILVDGIAPYAPYQSVYNSGDLSINDRGDLLVRGSGWVASGATSITLKDTLFMRSAGETSFRQQFLDDSKLYGWAVRMDNQGALLVAAQYRQNGSTDIVAFRGTVDSGIVLTPTLLDTRASDAQLQAMGVGLNGQQVIMWGQNNGVRDTWYSAIAPSASAAFAVADMGVSFATTFSNTGYLNPVRRLFVTDSGDVLLYDLSGPLRTRWTAAAGWGAATSIPELASVNGYQVGFNRRGDYLRLDSADVGNTKAYDGGRNVTLPAPGYVLGTATQANNSNPNFYLYSTAYAAPLLSVGGVGFSSILWNFDVLPTPALPAGDGRNAVKNLWGVYLK